MGYYYALKQRYQDALNLADELRADLERTPALLTKADLIEGSIWYERKKPAKALYFWRNAAQNAPDNANALLLQGHALQALERHYEAIEKYRRSSELNPKNISVWYSWGITLYRLQDFAAAITKFQRITAFNPTYADAYNHWGIALFKLKRYTEGMTRIQQAIRLNPHEPAFHLRMAEGMMYLQEHERAIQKLYAVLSMPKNNTKNAQAACELIVRNLKKLQETIRLPPACQEVQELLRIKT